VVLVELEAPAELELELVHAELDVIDVLDEVRLLLFPFFLSSAPPGQFFVLHATCLACVEFLVIRPYLHQRVCEAFVLVALHDGVFDAGVLLSDLVHQHFAETPQLSRFFGCVQLNFFA
jgi:hypothetical protein